ncbi:MAG: gluconate 2-dehydrogenase subunit 3 family protein [Candidatus Binatia bacterium]
MGLALTRRQVLRWGILGGAVGVVRGHGLLLWRPARAAALAPPSGGFLTPEEKQIVTAVSGRIVPTDELPGAVEAGAPDYIDALLSFVPGGDANCDGTVTAADLAAVAGQAGLAGDAACPRADVDANGTIDAADAAAAAGLLFQPGAQLQAAAVFAGGPFSGRNPFPDPGTGTPSDTFPPNDFLRFIPLTRLQLMSWRVQLLGTAAVPGSDFNVAILGPVIGWRERYRSGLAGIQSASRQMFGADFVALAAAQQDAVLAASDRDFVDLITDHTLEGMFAAPEYGGNTNRLGWDLIGYDGDSQPLGYSIFNEATMDYNERPDKPNSAPNPDEDFSGVDAATAQFLTILVRLVGGPHFP